MNRCESIVAFLYSILTQCELYLCIAVAEAINDLNGNIFSFADKSLYFHGEYLIFIILRKGLKKNS